MVIAVPAPSPVEGDEEQVCLFDGLEEVRRVGSLEHGVAERGAQPAEHGRAGEELDHLLREAGDVLVAEVVRDEAVAATESRRGCRGRALCLDRESRQVEACRPALRAPGQLHHVGVAQAGAGTAQEHAGLLAGHAQVVGADLEQRTVRAQARQRQLARSAGREHELRPLWNVLGKRGDGVEALLASQELQLVEHDHDRVPERQERGSQLRHDSRPDRCAGGGQSLEDGRVDRRDPVERNRDVREEDDRIVVAVVDRHPGERTLISAGPLGEQRGLSVPDLGDDPHHRHPARPEQASDELRPRHRARANRWTQLGLDQGEGPGRGGGGCLPDRAP